MLDDKDKKKLIDCQPVILLPLKQNRKNGYIFYTYNKNKNTFGAILLWKLCTMYIHLNIKKKLPISTMTSHTRIRNKDVQLSLLINNNNY